MFPEDSRTCLPLLIFHLDERLNVCVPHQECGPKFTSVSTLSCFICHCLPLHSTFSPVFCRVNFRLASINISVSFRILCHISLCLSLNPTMKERKWSRSVVSNSLNPMDYSLLGSSVHGILQARVLEWVAISFSRGSSPPRDRTPVSCPAGTLYRLNHQGPILV